MLKLVLYLLILGINLFVTINCFLCKFEGYIAEFWEGRSFYTFYFGTILAGLHHSNAFYLKKYIYIYVFFYSGSALSILWKYLRGQRGWSIGGGVAVMGLIGSMVELQQLDVRRWSYKSLEI
jgi:hypothetical protein